MPRRFGAGVEHYLAFGHTPGNTHCSFEAEKGTLGLVNFIGFFLFCGIFFFSKQGSLRDKRNDDREQSQGKILTFSLVVQFIFKFLFILFHFFGFLSSNRTSKFFTIERQL